MSKVVVKRCLSAYWLKDVRRYKEIAESPTLVELIPIFVICCLLGILATHAVIISILQCLFVFILLEVNASTEVD